MIWLEGCGAGILLMLPYLWVNLSPLHADLYHRLLPMNTVFGGMAIDLVAACLLCTGALWLLEKFDPRGHTLWWVLLAAIAMVKLWDLADLEKLLLAHIELPLVGLAFVGAMCLIGALALWLLQRSWYGKAVQGFRLALALLGVCIVWMLPELVYMAVHPEPHFPPQFAHAVPPADKPERRVIWILFDELSQDQVFDHRQPGISLPELDRFRSQSVMFSDMQPAGYFTTLVVPSLMSGRIIKSERSNLSGNLSVRIAGHWEPFPIKQSLFADARRDGWSTGVAGWYNPYCRLYSDSLNWCAWAYRDAILGSYEQGKSLWWNVDAPLAGAEAEIAGREDAAAPGAERHVADYEDLMRWSHELIDDEDVGFVFLVCRSWVGVAIPPDRRVDAGRSDVRAAAEDSQAAPVWQAGGERRRDGEERDERSRS